MPVLASWPTTPRHDTGGQPENYKVGQLQKLATIFPGGYCKCLPFVLYLRQAYYIVLSYYNFSQ